MIDDKILNNSDIVCIYHCADFDGICSAEIVRKYFSEYKNIKHLDSINISFIGLDYGYNIPYDKLIDKVIICCDFTPQNFIDIIKKSKYTLWIDHHLSSIKDMKDVNFENFEKVLSVDYSACEGVWRYFYSNNDLPIAINYMSLFDSHLFTPEQKNDVMSFQYGLKSLGKSVEIGGKSWEDLINSYQFFIDEILIRGSIVKQYHTDHFDLQICKRTARDIVLKCPKSGKEYNGIFINSAYSFSEVFQSVYDTDKHDIFLLAYNSFNNMWKYSIYCPPDKDIDVSLIAKEFGGGGHKGASGFSSDKLIV